MKKELTAAAIVLALTGQTTLLAPKAIAGEIGITYRQLVGTQRGQSELIQQELKNFKVRVQSGAMNQQESIEAMSKSMIDKNITLADIDAFVQSTATEKEYRNFRKTLVTAMKGVDTEQMNPRQLSEVLASAMQNSSIEGLAWSGCAGLSIGVILVVSAAIVGVVALTKSKGEARVKASFDRKRADLSAQLNRDLLDINTKTQKIQNEITSTQGNINSNNQRIDFLVGQIAGASPGNPNTNAWAQEIQSLRSENQRLTDRIAELKLQLKQWQDPVYVQTQIDNTNAQYQTSLDALNQKEQNDLALIPANRELAKKLGIGAGVGAAIGAYLIADGASDGC